MGCSLKASIAIFLCTFLYFLLPLTAFYLFYNGSTLIRAILLLSLVYQYTLCQESQTFRKIVAWGAPIEFFKDHGLIFEDPDTASSPEKRVMLCYHPHGVMAYGVTLLTYQFNYLNDFVRLGSRFALLVPWGGLFLKLSGIQGINPENLNHLMKSGRKILMLPGGFEEATITNHNENRVFVKNRKGFIKYALKYGYTVHPCYGFNENKAFYCFTNVKLGLLMNKFKIPGVMFYSRFFGILPNNDHGIYFVIGKGIKFPKIEKPSKEEINYYHELYVSALQGTYEKFKGRFGITGELHIY